MDIKKRNTKMAIISMIISVITLLVFIFAPIIHKENEVWTGLDFLTKSIILGSRLAIGNLICVWALVIILLVDIGVCIFGIVTGKFFRKFQYAILSVILLFMIILMAIYVINNIYVFTTYINYPSIREELGGPSSLINFFNAFAGLNTYKFTITIWCYLVALGLVSRVVLQLLGSTRKAYEEERVAEKALNEEIDASLAREVGTTQEEIEEPVATVVESTLEEKVAKLRVDAPNHKAWTEEMVLNYVSTRCKYTINTNRISGARYIMVEDKAIGYIGTLKDGSKRLILRTEPDVAFAMTTAFDNVDYTAVPRSPKWITIGEGISMNIVSFVLDTSIDTTISIAREEKAVAEEYEERLIVADKAGKADVDDLCDIVKNLKAAEAIKADKRNYVSFKYNNKTFAFVAGKDIYYKLVVKIDEDKLDMYKDKFGIVLTKAKFPVTAGWYYIDSAGDLANGKAKRLLVDAYNNAKKM